MRDLPIYLPPMSELEALTISADFSIVSEVMQRALVLLVCHDDEALKIDGKRLLQFLQQTTTGAVADIAPMLSDIADALKDMLNDGYADGGYENLVEYVSFDVSVDGTTATVNLVIQQADSEQEEMVVYKYE